MRDNLARKLNHTDSPSGKKVKLVRKKKRKSGVILMSIICFALGLVIIQRFAYIYSLNNMYRQNQEQLRVLKASNEQRKIELEQSIDLKSLDKIAKQELNMHKPTDKQIIKVNVKNNDTAKILNEASGNKFFYAMLTQSAKTIPNYLNK